MNIIINNPEDLEKTGVYKILNLINNKYYIGSTKQSFKARMNHHLQALRNNKHKNSHLQKAWNKYGEDNFQFFILEICNKDETYIREQFYLDNRDINLSYNINTMATGPSLEQETLNKLSIIRKEFYSKCMPFYYKVKNKEMQLDEVPDIYKEVIIAHLNNIPWNKGKSYESTEHLKVKHTFTDKLKNKYKNFSERVRENSEIVYVYTKEWEFIDRFRSAKDLADLSKNLNLPIKSRFKNKRGSCDINELQSCNINKAIKTGNTYKNLYFTNVPVHPGMDDLNEPKSVNSEMGIPR